jgi:hypothetical protein
MPLSYAERTSIIQAVPSEFTVLFRDTSENIVANKLYADRFIYREFPAITFNFAFGGELHIEQLSQLFDQTPITETKEFKRIFRAVESETLSMNFYDKQNGGISAAEVVEQMAKSVYDFFRFDFGTSTLRCISVSRVANLDSLEGGDFIRRRQFDAVILHPTCKTEIVPIIERVETEVIVE